MGLTTINAAVGATRIKEDRVVEIVVDEDTKKSTKEKRVSLYCRIVGFLRRAYIRFAIAFNGRKH